jgi:hypothetical protein
MADEYSAEAIEKMAEYVRGSALGGCATAIEIKALTDPPVDPDIALVERIWRERPLSEPNVETALRTLKIGRELEREALKPPLAVGQDTDRELAREILGPYNLAPFHIDKMVEMAQRVREAQIEADANPADDALADLTTRLESAEREREEWAAIAGSHDRERRSAESHLSQATTLIAETRALFTECAIHEFRNRPSIEKLSEHCANLGVFLGRMEKSDNRSQEAG